jgi:hypothetical protein
LRTEVRRATYRLERAGLQPRHRAIVRTRLKLELSLHTMLQVLSVPPFEKIPLIQLFSDIEENPNMTRDDNQLILL